MVTRREQLGTADHQLGDDGNDSKPRGRGRPKGNTNKKEPQEPKTRTSRMKRPAAAVEKKSDIPDKSKPEMTEPGDDSVTKEVKKRCSTSKPDMETTPEPGDDGVKNEVKKRRSTSKPDTETTHVTEPDDDGVKKGVKKHRSTSKPDKETTPVTQPGHGDKKEVKKPRSESKLDTGTSKGKVKKPHPKSKTAPVGNKNKVKKGSKKTCDFPAGQTAKGEETTELAEQKDPKQPDSNKGKGSKTWAGRWVPTDPFLLKKFQAIRYVFDTFVAKKIRSQSTFQNPWFVACGKAFKGLGIDHDDSSYQEFVDAAMGQVERFLDLESVRALVAQS